MAGTRATMTPYMFFSTDSLPWACGDNETINLLILFLLGSLRYITSLCCEHG